MTTMGEKLMLAKTWLLLRANTLNPSVILAPIAPAETVEWPVESPMGTGLGHLAVVGDSEASWSA
jgi:hypothetical protein